CCPSRSLAAPSPARSSVVPLLRSRRGLRGRSTADERDELAPFQLIELHSVPPARAGLHDIEWARISQVITERFCNLLAVGEGPIRRSGESVWRITAIEASPAPVGQPR